MWRIFCESRPDLAKELRALKAEVNGDYTPDDLQAWDYRLDVAAMAITLLIEDRAGLYQRLQTRARNLVDLNVASLDVKEREREAQALPACSPSEIDPTQEGQGEASLEGKSIEYAFNNVACLTDCGVCCEAFKPRISEECSFVAGTRIPVCDDCEQAAMGSSAGGAPTQDDAIADPPPF